MVEYKTAQILFLWSPMWPLQRGLYKCLIIEMLILDVCVFLHVLFCQELSRCILKNRYIKKICISIYQLILLLIFVSSSTIYVTSDNLRMICSFTCMNYCHVTTIMFFSFQLKEEKRKVKASHLLHTWNKMWRNLAIRIAEKSKEKKMWRNYTKCQQLNYWCWTFQ